MIYKIAAASRDGKMVTEPFDECARFLILRFDSEKKTWACDGFRTLGPPLPGGRGRRSVGEIADALSDCRIVLVAKIDPPAEVALIRRGADVLKYYGRIEDALRRILQYYR